MTKKKAIVISIILGLIALLEIGGAVSLLFYYNKIKASVPITTEVPTPTMGSGETPIPTKETGNTPVPTLTPAHTSVPTQAPTHTPEPTKAPTATPAPTHTPEPTKAPTATPAPSHTPAPTKAPTATPVPTKAPTATPVPTKVPTATPIPTKTPTPFVKPADDKVVAPSSSGRLHVEGISIVDENGQAVQLKGISTAGLQWFPQFVDQKAFHEFRYEWGVNIMRLAMYTDEGGYCAGGNKASLKAWWKKA